MTATLTDLALSALAMAFGGAAVLAWGVVLRRDGAAAPRSWLRTGEARGNDHANGSRKEATQRAALTRYPDTSDPVPHHRRSPMEHERDDALMRWPGPVLPDAEGCTCPEPDPDYGRLIQAGCPVHMPLPAREPDPNSYEGRGFDPGEPYQRGETE